MHHGLPKRFLGLQVRLSHWINVIAMVCMWMSGFGIYNAYPLFAFRFPLWMTLGDWLGGNIAWHLAFMWLFGINGLLYVIWNVFSGHFFRDIFTLSPAKGWQELKLAFTFKLHHRLGSYNQLQRIMYLIVILLGGVMVLSGLVIWKPVQFSALGWWMGGFEIARYVHFITMSLIALFVVVHVVMVILVPKTLVTMITGGVRDQI